MVAVQRLATALGTAHGTAIQARDEPRAEQLAKSATSLSELLNRKGLRVERRGKVLMHAHCHQKVLWGTGDDLQLLRKAGVELLTPDTGCCGMAGSFGYRPEFYDTLHLAELLAPA